ncbi:Leucine-rich repeat serine/threonine-protein kinase 2 [Labeo rohita]|uniref:Leucine-rich repeat serine/threonine-protein kinase 2 n=1 Tax=Labeo rohita TaxID=84645 RepID=A0ABQ8LY92_LABRO|nr:Leucine-rich repeat serine/threonine-protein kinase 2 [Labeo rohita]
MIATISKSVEFNAAEIKECKQKCGVLEKQAAALLKSTVELRSKTSETERYKRRWNLHIKGLKKHADEDA